MADGQLAISLWSEVEWKVNTAHLPHWAKYFRLILDMLCMSRGHYLWLTNKGDHVPIYLRQLSKFLFRKINFARTSGQNNQWLNKTADRIKDIVHFKYIFSQFDGWRWMLKWHSNVKPKHSGGGSVSVCSLGTDLGPACGCQTEPEVWGCKLQPETDAWLSGQGRRGVCGE